jgi:hypothetical protein
VAEGVPETAAAAMVSRSVDVVVEMAKPEAGAVRVAAVSESAGVSGGAPVFRKLA